MMVNARLAALAAAAIALTSATATVAAPTPHLAFAAPPARPFHPGFFRHDGFSRTQAFGDRRGRFGGQLPFYGGYGAFYGGYPAEVATYAPPPPPVYAPSPPPYPYAAAADTKVCPVVWTWSARRHEATRRSYCD